MNRDTVALERPKAGLPLALEPDPFCHVFSPAGVWRPAFVVSKFAPPFAGILSTSAVIAILHCIIGARWQACAPRFDFQNAEKHASAISRPQRSEFCTVRPQNGGRRECRAR